jgi:tRNA threonylcarbamoyl adenosine modification protein (Sua5/YciO/YrdC/YwlC family)
MATIYTIHPDTPQSREIEQVRNALREGAVMLYPTDTVYAIGCDIHSKAAVERVRRIKQLSNEKPLTFLCPSLSNIAQYAEVTDSAYRIMRRLIPGPVTFLLPATKLVPRLVMNPKRKTTGIRVPDHAICRSLLNALENPIVSTSANPTDDVELDHKNDHSSSGTASQHVSKAELFDCFEKLVDVVIDDELDLNYHVSTILDLTTDEPTIVRRGLGWEAIAPWAVEA